ncbi:site-specific DNA-methyltransferase [Falsiroseomonas bella]|uniref:site-specific DNA-methyltransferase (adenine-specific) n=1 Tax=Falsiroseomonas bella TaxID=2184016 RepID=A0A317F7G4_9PROT|nr:site-specific DNA-methyltransferase [Falsiroseomonas bella]PWS34343.1 site-specific DNA-methyltransferase [Falsiroseomonas bella]
MARPKKLKPDAPATEVETLVHPADIARKNIPTAETAALMAEEEARAEPKLYPRNPDLDPQLVWRGKDEQDSAPLRVETVPIYIQEKLYPEALIRDLQRVSATEAAPQADLFGSFDRITDEAARLEFYQHAENWSNRMILGDSLLVMNSLAEKEGLRGQVQMIYLDPPYGIRFASNWQPSTRSRDVKEGKADGMSREPEQIKAFRDTWKDGIHSYLAYLRDRLIVARELLSESGSIFVQIGDENVHLVRNLLDEVFGSENFLGLLVITKTSGQTSEFLSAPVDYVAWFAKNRSQAKYRPLFLDKPRVSGDVSLYPLAQDDAGWRRPLSTEERTNLSLVPENERLARLGDLTSARQGRPSGEGSAMAFRFPFRGREYAPSGTRGWSTTVEGIARAAACGRVEVVGDNLRLVRFFDDFPVQPMTTVWDDTHTGSFTDPKVYVVQTGSKVVQRCMLMTTDPGDLVLDPTCGSGTTAFVAEQWGRRWITTDTSRVALALARTRLMAGRFPAYLLRDSREGAAKEGEITGRPPEEGPFRHDIRQGLVLERVPHVTLKSIANNAEIDVIHANWVPKIEAALAALNTALGTQHAEWQVPRNLPEDAKPAAQEAHAAFWAARRARQAEMDASIARNAETEFLHDRPYAKKNAVRVTGPFTVESLSPHRVLPADEDDQAVMEALAQEAGEPVPERRPLRTRPDAGDDFVTAVLDNLQKAGVQNTKKDERLTFATLRPWPGGSRVSAEGEYEEAGVKKRAAIVIGPEYGTVGPDLVREAARECRDWADAMVVCGFAFDPQVGDSTMNLGRLVVLKARMSQELRAAEAYKAGGGNLFVVFGEPDIALDQADGAYVVRLKGVDIFDPTTGEVRSSGRVEDDVACWFVDTDYDGDSFFVRHAYFLGGKDPFEKLKTALKAEVDEDAWASLYRTESRPFVKPKSGRIAVKVINHYGDEAMRVFRL